MILTRASKCAGVGWLAAITKSLEGNIESIMRKYYFVTGARLAKEFRASRGLSASKAVALTEKFLRNCVSRVIGEVKLAERHEKSE